MYGLFNLTGFRDPGTTTMQIMSDTTEMVRLADQGGMEMAWFAEHHFSNYCVCPSPLLMAAHCAGVTTRIKLATGIVVLPLYMPARLIAEIGMVDALSKGRLVLGVGSGYQPFEFERFGVDLATAQAQTIEILDMIEAGLGQRIFEYGGEYFQQPPTHISARGPQGVPEIWIAGDSPKLQRIAAERGYTPIFTGRMDGPGHLIAQRDRCAAAFADAGKDPASLRFGTLRFTCVTDSKAEARDFADNALFQNRLAGSLRRRQEVMEDNGMMREIPVEGEPSIDDIVKNLIIGDVETCIEKCVAEIQQVGAVHTAMFFQVGNFPHRAAMRSLERFAGEVIPGIEKIVGPLDRLAQRTAA
jgi:alkanesulfonate monooxygenase SsuD/methylene tetrahydromethanopterin reductase-like flavin-dependent oxidoreductase (luciferase family)